MKCKSYLYYYVLSNNAVCHYKGIKFDDRHNLKWLPMKILCISRERFAVFVVRIVL